MWIEIDGSQGEGGGQIVRTSLTLSLLTGRGLRLDGVRAGRKKPGLLRQHLTAARAAAAISHGSSTDAELGARRLSFRPGTVRGGTYEFAVGTAGSALLVLQTILLPLCLADSPSRVTLEGGTHNPWAPTFEFLDRVFLPVLQRFGPRVRATLERPGFYPAGGGRLQVDIEPVSRLEPVEMMERGELVRRSATAKVAHIAPRIARRELQEVQRQMAWEDDSLVVEEVPESLGPGNVLNLELIFEHVTEIFTGFGRMQASAKRVAKEACEEARQYLAAGVPVGKHLADQLLLPMAVAGGGRFRTVSPSRHTLTQRSLLQRFLPIDIEITRGEHAAWTASLTPRSDA